MTPTKTNPNASTNNEYVIYIRTDQLTDELTGQLLYIPVQKGQQKYAHPNNSRLKDNIINERNPKIREPSTLDYQQRRGQQVHGRRPTDHQQTEQNSGHFRQAQDSPPIELASATNNNLNIVSYNCKNTH